MSKKQILRPDSQRPRVSFEGLEPASNYVDILLFVGGANYSTIYGNSLMSFFLSIFEHRLVAKCHSNSNYQ